VTADLTHLDSWHTLLIYIVEEPMVRTQIYLTENEKETLQSLSKETGKTQSELIRTAIERFIGGIVKSCVWDRKSGGLFPDAIFEHHTSDNISEERGAVERAPVLLGRHRQLVNHRQAGDTTAAALGLVGA
jgi:ribbon-helix-helix CopG family protein